MASQNSAEGQGSFCQKHFRLHNFSASKLTKYFVVSVYLEFRPFLPMKHLQFALLKAVSLEAYQCFALAHYKCVF